MAIREKIKRQKKVGDCNWGRGGSFLGDQKCKTVPCWWEIMHRTDVYYIVYLLYSEEAFVEYILFLSVVGRSRFVFRVRYPFGSSIKRQ